MKETTERREGGFVCTMDGTVTLSHAAAEHMQAALEQMDLLLQTQQMEVGLPHLVALLQHLRALRCTIA